MISGMMSRPRGKEWRFFCTCIETHLAFKLRLGQTASETQRCDLLFNMCQRSFQACAQRQCDERKNMVQVIRASSQ